jgi:hypothetical protein
MSNFKLKATHAPVKAYYETLERFGRGKFDNEGNIRRAFEALLEKCARTYEWFLVAEYPLPRSGRNPLKVDAAVLDAFNLPRGYWDAKDEKDDLKAEMNKKIAEGYRVGQDFGSLTRAMLRFYPARNIDDGSSSIQLAFVRPGNHAGSRDRFQVTGRQDRCGDPPADRLGWCE